jgi:hypothetical protein
MSMLVAALVVLGFAQTYPAKAFAPGAGLPTVIHLHALVFCCWLLLFVAQTVLALRGRLDLHQKLGTIGVLLAALMLALGAAASLTAARLGHRGIPGVEFPDAGGFLLLNLAGVAVFSILVAAAWLFRHRPQVHKRLMLTALVGGLAPPGLARLPFVAGHAPAIAGVVLVLLLAGPVYDLLTRRRLHPAYAFGLVVALMSIPPVVAQVSASEQWRHAVAWLLK